VTDCVWTMRSGRQCQSVALVGDYCAGHWQMREALVREDREREGRGQAPMSLLERDVFLRRLRHERKAERWARLARVPESAAAGRVPGRA
jgi:hypothetical protein